MLTANTTLNRAQATEMFTGGYLATRLLEAWIDGNTDATDNAHVFTDEGSPAMRLGLIIATYQRTGWWLDRSAEPGDQYLATALIDAIRNSTTHYHHRTVSDAWAAAHTLTGGNSNHPEHADNTDTHGSGSAEMAEHAGTNDSTDDVIADAVIEVVASVDRSFNEMIKSFQHLSKGNTHALIDAHHRYTGPGSTADARLDHIATLFDTATAVLNRLCNGDHDTIGAELDHWRRDMAAITHPGTKTAAGN